MLKQKIVSCAAIIAFLCMTFGNCVYADTRINNADYDENDWYLISTGMDEASVAALDDDIKEFMVNDLKSAEAENFIYVDLEDENMIQPLAETLTGISLTASAFKSGDIIYIYPTYEFTTNKQPRGNDSFSFQLANAFSPYEYGGQLWCKDDQTMTQWAVAGSLTANRQELNGAEFSGSQLGSAGWAMKFKGCAYCHARVGSGTDKRIILNYLYNPNNVSYSISFSAYGLGISYSPSGTAYTAANTVTLSY